ncbi:MAG: NAD-binding protein [Acidobacteria bacterium]|nr:NAD-binding protein [Acidobacteriota bacterium]
MKFLVSQITYFVNRRETRRNISGLVKYLIFLCSIIFLFTVIFHFLMVYHEQREFSWFSGLYWTLTVMTTLGFGDITFNSDLGRIFSVVVLISGVILLLIMLPFTFIQSFYAPWLEAQLHAGCPREVPAETNGHVIICKYDTIAPNLIRKLNQKGIPYFVIEADARAAADLHHEGISVIHGNVESVSTYKNLSVGTARLVFANDVDTVNSNIILTVREAAPDIPIVAVAEAEDSIDILELSGANHVLPLKTLLGEKLAGRINIGKERVNVINTFNGWNVFEFSIQDTIYSGMRLSESNLRQNTGISIIGLWERGILTPVGPDTILTDTCVPVGVGTPEQVEIFNRKISNDPAPNSEAVLLIGGGKVGRAAARELKKQNRRVFLVEAKGELREVIGDVPDRLTIGDASDRHILEKGGLNEASLVILSTNQDDVNIYLTIYCRRLNPDLKIISRITHSRNLEAVHRAGADFVLSYSPLGAESVMSLIEKREPVILGEGVEFFSVDVPPKIKGKTLAESDIGALSGLIVLAVESEGEIFINPAPDFRFPEAGMLNVLGTGEQLAKLNELFG